MEYKEFLKLKYEVTIRAIKELKEEYSNNLEILKKLDSYEAEL